ncbi:MAG: T9SS type A sorting domain-containing protein [Ignavibacteriales bacterium]|nr:MAG: T9SS type A sorting domain-containing protein [Ignavibacteriales bacterium]
MKLVIVIFLVLINFFFSNNNIYAQNFLPLDKGNVWIWENTEWDSLIRTTIVDSNVIINNKNYYKIRLYNDSEVFSYSRYSESDSLYYRYSENYPYNDGDIPYYKKNCVVGDTFSFPLSQVSTSVVAVVDAYQAPVFDTTFTIKKLHINNGGLTEFYQFWTDEVGMLSMIDFPWGNPLTLTTGCLINNKVYGDTTYPVGINDEQYFIYNFELYQNYPNPFNPTTTINYQIPQTGFVQLKIYDLLGAEVETLVDEITSEGYYSVNFNAANLPSGVYIYSLRVNDFVQNNKMTVLK